MKTKNTFILKKILSPLFWLLPITYTLLITLQGFLGTILNTQSLSLYTFLLRIMVLTVSNIGANLLLIMACQYINSNAEAQPEFLRSILHITRKRIPIVAAFAFLHILILCASFIIPRGLAYQFNMDKGHLTLLSYGCIFVWNVVTFFVIPIISFQRISLLASIQQSYSMVQSYLTKIYSIFIIPFAALHILTDTDITSLTLYGTFKIAWLFIHPRLFLPFASGTHMSIFF